MSNMTSSRQMCRSLVAGLILLSRGKLPRSSEVKFREKWLYEYAAKSRFRRCAGIRERRP